MITQVKGSFWVDPAYIDPDSTFPPSCRADLARLAAAYIVESLESGPPSASISASTRGANIVLALDALGHWGGPDICPSITVSLTDLVADFVEIARDEKATGDCEMVDEAAALADHLQSLADMLRAV